VFPAALTEHRSVSRGADSLSLLGLSSDVQMFQLAEQRLTQLMMGDKSERAQKVFALDYCASAFVTEGAPSTTPPAVPRACRVRRDGEPWRSANQASGRGCARRTREVRDAHWEKRFRGTVGHQHAAAVTRVGARTRLREERVLVGSSY
jgi:hypothetical protein